MIRLLCKVSFLLALHSQFALCQSSSFNETLRSLEAFINRHDQDNIKATLETLPHLNATDNSGETVLFYAARARELKLAIYLVENGISINHKNKRGHSAYMVAIANQSTEVAKYLIEQDVYKDISDQVREDALFWAIPFENKKMLLYLLEKEIDVNTTDNLGRTPLMLAAKQKRLDFVQWLFESGANLEAKDRGGFTALTYAAVESYKDDGYAVLKFLLEQGANPYVGNKKDKSRPLDVVFESRARKLIKAYLKYRKATHKPKSRRKRWFSRMKAPKPSGSHPE